MHLSHNISSLHCLTVHHQRDISDRLQQWFWKSGWNLPSFLKRVGNIAPPAPTFCATSVWSLTSTRVKKINCSNYKLTAFLSMARPGVLTLHFLRERVLGEYCTIYGTITLNTSWPHCSIIVTYVSDLRLLQFIWILPLALTRYPPTILQ